MYNIPVPKLYYLYYIHLYHVLILIYIITFINILDYTIEGTMMKTMMEINHKDNIVQLD